jgi:hypothetical protein
MNPIHKAPGSLPKVVNIDGRLDSKDSGIMYFGNAILQPNEEYHVMANVHGALCRVSVTLTYSDINEDQAHG